MKIQTLIKKLEKIEKRHGNVHIHIDADRFKRWHECWQYNRVSDVKVVEGVVMTDGDGFMKESAREYTIVSMS